MSQISLTTFSFNFMILDHPSSTVFWDSLVSTSQKYLLIVTISNTNPSQFLYPLTPSTCWFLDSLISTHSVILSSTLLQLLWSYQYRKPSIGSISSITLPDYHLLFSQFTHSKNSDSNASPTPSRPIIHGGTNCFLSNIPDSSPCYFPYWS